MLKIDLLHRRPAAEERAPDCPAIVGPLRSKAVYGSFVANRYRIQRLLGRGGMGAVYEALDTKTSTLVAVKVISEELAQNASLRSRFEQEQRAAAAIASPHLVQILDAGDDAGRPFMVMEYLRGEDLGQLLERVGPLSEQLALRIVGQASVGIGRAHEAGVVHRDIKPANIFLARSPANGAPGTITVKVLDFGVAKLIAAEGSVAEQGSLTRTGTVLGSPLYMSPEQARGGRAIGPRADIWSLGVVLYRALTGREPHDTVGGLGDLIIAICTRPSPPVQLNAPWLSRDVAALVHRALAIDPDARHRDAQELGEAIRKIAGELELREDELVGLPEPERQRRPPGSDDATLCMPTSGVRRPPTPSARAGGSKRILLVEDNELNMDMLARRLEKKGYEIVRATDGEAGVALGQSAHPDLVIMDIGLPGIDGWEASRRLRASGDSQTVPILALTAHAMGGEREKAIAAGCDDFESKPVEFPRLLAKIEALLSRR
jgi:serine/threonine protein kinase